MRWIYFVAVFLLSTACIVILGEYLAGPALRWLFHDIPYAFPSWQRMERAGLFVLLMGLLAGTVAWFYDKKSSGR
ncbi:hypothetical protein [Paraburkholderia sacchari]|uniref:hypothetical protein n=1 Tax=Paraburkholderia sacchari TaxID=159450 RepID=UPI001FD1DCED|nr:hypothetical protein [Paraburkholderia sacchari]